MKRLNRTFIKGTNWLLGGLLTLFGFNGCNILGGGLVEYGSPYATYTFRGKITNEVGEPLPDIKVEVQALYNDNNPVLSNEAGNYSTVINAFNDSFRLAFVDIDGETNGSYQNDTVLVKIDKNDYVNSGKGNWDYGSVTKEVNVVLKEKRQQAD